MSARELEACDLCGALVEPDFRQLPAPSARVCRECDAPDFDEVHDPEFMRYHSPDRVMEPSLRAHMRRSREETLIELLTSPEASLSPADDAPTPGRGDDTPVTRETDSYRTVATTDHGTPRSPGWLDQFIAWSRSIIRS